MRHTLKRVDDRAREIISWVRLVCLTGPVVRNVLGAIEDRITQALDLVLHVELGTNAVGFVVASEHAFEELKIFLNRVATVDTLDTLISLLFHLFSGSAISIRVASCNERAHVTLQHFKVIRTECDLVWGDAKRLQVVDDVVDKLNLFVHWVSIVEAQNHLSVVHL